MISGHSSWIGKDGMGRECIFGSSACRKIPLTEASQGSSMASAQFPRQSSFGTRSGANFTGRNVA